MSQIANPTRKAELVYTLHLPPTHIHSSSPPPPPYPPLYSASQTVMKAAQDCYDSVGCLHKFEADCVRAKRFVAANVLFNNETCILLCPIPGSGFDGPIRMWIVILLCLCLVVAIVACVVFQKGGEQPSSPAESVDNPLLGEEGGGGGGPIVAGSVN